MKEFRLEPVNKQINEMLEEMLVYLQEFEELKDCRIENGYITLNSKYLLNIKSYDGSLYIDTCWETIWQDINLNREDVFEARCDHLTTLKIKEPQPHQARKKKLEELEIGDSYYKFNFISWNFSENRLVDEKCWTRVTIQNASHVWQLKNSLKHARILVALDEEEIKNKVLD